MIAFSFVPRGTIKNRQAFCSTKHSKPRQMIKWRNLMRGGFGQAKCLPGPDHHFSTCDSIFLGKQKVASQVLLIHGAIRPFSRLSGVS